MIPRWDPTYFLNMAAFTNWRVHFLGVLPDYFGVYTRTLDSWKLPYSLVILNLDRSSPEGSGQVEATVELL